MALVALRQQRTIRLFSNGALNSKSATDNGKCRFVLRCVESLLKLFSVLGAFMRLVDRLDSEESREVPDAQTP